MKSNILKIVLLMVSLAGLVGCGEDSRFKETSNSSGGTVTNGTYTLAAATTTPVIVVGTTALISATLVDGDQLGIAGETVTFTVDNGAFGPSKYTQVVTDSNGAAYATLSAPVLVGSGKVTVTYGDQSQTVNMSYLVGPAANISLNASPSVVGVTSDSTLTTQLQDQYGNAIANEAMQFTITTKGSVNPSLTGTGIVQTNSSGVATIVYTSGSNANTTGVIDTVRVAPLNGGTISTTINITVKTTATTITTLTLKQDLASTSMKVGKTQGLTATLLDSTNTPVAGQTVDFVLVGDGTLSDGTTVDKLVTATTDANGEAIISLNAPLLLGSAQITAASAGKSANITVNYVADVPTTVVLSASPATVGVSSDSTLTATVFDQYGNLSAGEAIVFSFVGTTSAYFTPTDTSGNANATTNSNGVATVLYTSGPAGGSDTVRVTIGTTPNTTADVSAVTSAADTSITVSTSLADVASVTLGTASLSSNLTVTTNITTPSTDAIEATVRDTNGQLVSDGTVVAFELVGSGTLSKGTTSGKSLTATTVNGVATVTLTAPQMVGAGSITAAIAGKSDTLNITYIPGPAAVVSLSASPATVGTSSVSTLTATVRDVNGNVTPYEQVIFSYAPNGNNSGGTLNPVTGYASTNNNGVATMGYISGVTPATDTVRVTIGSTADTTADVSAVDTADDVTITVSSATANVASVSLATGSLLTNLVVSTAATSSTDTIEATVLDTNGQLVNDGTTVAFELIGTGTLSKGTVSGKSLTATTVNGVASVTLTAPLLVATDTIKATIAGKNATIDITYTPDVPTLVTLAANPSPVGALSTSTLTATVTDVNGNLTPGEPVVFTFASDTTTTPATSLNKSGGYLTPATTTGAANATTDLNGEASVLYTSGSLAGVIDTLRVDVTNGTNVSDTVTISVSSGAVPVPTKMTISTDSTTIPSDDTLEATITAIVLDSANVVVPGAMVNFSSSGGVLSSGQVQTDVNGEAVVTLRAGSDPTNQTITVTASSTGVSDALVPVDVVGSTVTITPNRSNLILGGVDTATLTIKAADSGGTGIYSQNVSLSIDGTASTGAATLSNAGGMTNTLGEWSVNLTGVAAGTVRVLAKAMGATTFHDFTVESLAGSLMITSPASGATAPINTATTVSIDVPAGITDLTLVSSLGTWSNAGMAVGAGTSSLTWGGLVGPTTVTADLTSVSIGTASIKVADKNNTVISDSIQVVFVDTTVDATSTISMQASPTTVQPSAGGTLNSSQLLANVKNGMNQPIAGARVTFRMSNTTGSGEYIDPPVAYTDAYGVARATFYSGTQSTDATGLVVTAELEQALTGAPAPQSSVNVIVNGTAGAIAIGTSTTISSINNDTAYKLPMSVQVTDSGGNPVPNTEVILSLWPQEYAIGFWDCDALYRETVLANEDNGNKNLIMDPGEDFSGDGTLTPPISAGGSIPSSVTTDDNGVATFDLVYLKDYAGFIDDALTATALVQGTETRATLRFTLEAMKSDVKGSCLLGESPLNAHWPTLTVTAEQETVFLNGGGTNIFISLTDSNGQPIKFATLDVGFSSQGTFLTVSPTLDGANPTTTVTTDGFGQAVVVYQNGDRPLASDWIRVGYLTPSNVVITAYVRIATMDQ